MANTARTRRLEQILAQREAQERQAEAEGRVCAYCGHTFAQGEPKVCGEHCDE